MRLSVVQMSPGADKAENLRQASRLITAAHAADRPGLVMLPEIWTCLGGDRAGKFAAAEKLPPPGSGEAGGVAYSFLRELAVGLGIYLHGGSIGELDPEDPAGRICNTSLLFAPDGREVARYRKIHLFDITTPDGQGYRESATYRPGSEIVTCPVGGLTVGLAICYDLRFPALFAALRAAGAELILLPAAFTAQTGRDHWEPLLRARAIETQCWLAAAATCGAHVEMGRRGAETRHTYGQSLIADPWGLVVARASDGEGFATARIEPELTRRIRRDMPLAAHHRPDLYPSTQARA